MGSVPRVAVSAQALRQLPLDHRSGFLVACVDGVSDVASILDVCAMRREEALDLLGRLVRLGAIELRTPASP